MALDNLVDFIVTCLSHPQAANQTFLVTLDHPLRTVNAQNSRFEAQGWIERSQKRMLLRVVCENGVVVTVVTVMATSKFEKYGVTP